MSPEPIRSRIERRVTREDRCEEFDAPRLHTFVPACMLSRSHLTLLDMGGCNG